MKYTLTLLSEAIERVTRTTINAVESSQAAPYKAIHAFFGKDPEIVKGDHISVFCGYIHHGIYIGDGMVIHFTKVDGLGIIQMDTIETFKNGKAIEIRNSPLNCSREEAIQKAYSKLYTTGYNLVFNNCEHFVVWCRDGDNKKIYTPSSAAWQVMGNR
ncbi:lecithin retinol acyltransferase family protein [Paenibacillus chitinolyticus]|uniref:Lecithin retinol acyltransferase family protein n=1 Tax=Paenibacillus chitinolyticus TaxID=79263 RepID=A0ABT4FMB0_9BACL|nr:lecithin retinol acyltransferase family protein [Paenibacillus chitinolyticus]MCY9593972.1 lecithin retinol acyltransferase family protein [Paenibacillus chitinolyticus]MCY9599627.1 lecithin retinol acyltransferase family protein [Paenibacillus chitinolyticus]